MKASSVLDVGIDVEGNEPTVVGGCNSFFQPHNGDTWNTTL